LAIMLRTWVRSFLESKHISEETRRFIYRYFWTVRLSAILMVIVGACCAVPIVIILLLRWPHLRIGSTGIRPGITRSADLQHFRKSYQVSETTQTMLVERHGWFLIETLYVDFDERGVVKKVEYDDF
jgi:hypothetical protein